MTAMFDLHPRLAQDSEPLVQLSLCQARLIKDARYPWLLLIPARDGLVEIHQLQAEDRGRLIEEIALASRTLEALFSPDKINVGALGNLVPQLHVHVIARRRGDPAWPGPVWGQGEALAYEPAEQNRIVGRLKAALEEG